MVHDPHHQPPSHQAHAPTAIVQEQALSDPAKRAFSEGTSFMTIDGPDLMAVLERRVRLDDLLRSKKRYANETGSCYFPASMAT